MSTRNLTKATFQDRVVKKEKPVKETLFGFDFYYEFMPESLKVVTAGDIVQKNFPSEASSKRTYFIQPEWFPADIGAKRIRTRMGIPDVDPTKPVYRHSNPQFFDSDVLEGEGKETRGLRMV